MPKTTIPAQGKGSGTRGVARVSSGRGSAERAALLAPPWSPCFSRAPRPPAERFVYCLVNKDWSRTYIGSTTKLDHRLRQHNMEIPGGAWCTRVSVRMGKPWSRAMHVTGFRCAKDAYKFEAAWKEANKKYTMRNCPDLLERKMRGLRELIPAGSRLQPVWNTYHDLTWE